MPKRAKHNKSKSAPVRWSCSQHQIPMGQECRRCTAQGVLFACTDATRRTTK